jgi:hypothetical protein
MRQCPYCAEEISEAATTCPFCRSDLSSAAQTQASPGSPDPAMTPGEPAPPAVGEGALEFSHSGVRYLLGYGPDFFGIWDRQDPGQAVRLFPRTDQGWAGAWTEYSRLEPNSMAVSMRASGGYRSPPSGQAAAASTGTAGATRPVSWAWWLLPVLFSLVGGLIAWAATRQRDPRTARWMLLLGVALFTLNVLLVLSGRFPMGGT